MDENSKKDIAKILVGLAIGIGVGEVALPDPPPEIVERGTFGGAPFGTISDIQNETSTTSP